jgi:hypothetical protein
MGVTGKLHYLTAIILGKKYTGSWACDRAVLKEFGREKFLFLL